MSDDPLIYPGDVQEHDSIRRRPDDEVERELAVDHTKDPEQPDKPGGAEGGEESRAADAIVDVPGEPGPLGDTDQHSDPDNVPAQREQENRSEQENRG